ncbi:replication-associated recombination protein A [Rothia sp. CCM 9418]|uniref:replication-associated recombination protein A n=1 Tax=unclassified Rothia (in: high G+C Gram-positive bacteria) TaxID=2689056 RepID=UPI003AD241C2
MTDSLFTLDNDNEEPSSEPIRSFTQAPLAVRMRPRTLDEVIGQKQLLHQGAPLRILAGESAGPAGPQSVILWGPPGTGKTTLAHVIAGGSGRKFVELSAITAGVKDVRQVMEQALLDRDMYGTTTVLFLDEIHRFSKAQQDALLPGVENRWVVLVAATTENPSFSIISPLVSRSLVLTLESLQDEDIRQLLVRAVEDSRGFGGKVHISEPALEHFVALSKGDARKALTALEAAVAAAYGQEKLPKQESIEESENLGPLVVSLEHAEEALNQASIRYDRNGDQHYDVISAFIKSIRGSDVDAALHYLARMLTAGEDPRFIARRLVVHASEDIGMADPTALTTAINAAQAVQLVGMPEARLNLAQATIHLATAPKSNAVIASISQALTDVKAGKGGAVPLHLRDSHYPGAAQMGHGRDYIYPHHVPFGVAEQQYLPDDLLGRKYYHPTEYGAEKNIASRLRAIAKILRGSSVRESSRKNHEK